MPPEKTTNGKGLEQVSELCEGGRLSPKALREVFTQLKADFPVSKLDLPAKWMRQFKAPKFMWMFITKHCVCAQVLHVCVCVCVVAVFFVLGFSHIGAAAATSVRPKHR